MTPHSILPRADYQYPNNDDTREFLTRLILEMFNTLQRKHGTPHFLDKGPTQWAHVCARIMYPEIPLDLWGTGEKVLVPIPWEMLVVGDRLYKGEFPPFLAVEAKPNGNDGIDHLRDLLN